MPQYVPITTGIESGSELQAAHLLNNFSAIQASVNNIEAGQLATNAVTSATIASGAVIAGKIGSNAVTSGTIATSAVTSGTILNGAVTSNKLASDSVTTAKVLDANITNAKLADEAKAYISKHTVSSVSELVVTNLEQSDYQQVEIHFNLSKSADNAPLELQLSTDNGSSFVTSSYSVGTEAKLIGGGTLGAQNGTSETSVELALFGTGANNGAVGRLEIGLSSAGDNVMGFFTTTCRRDGVTDTLVLRGGFRRFLGSGFNAFKLFVTGGTLTGEVTVTGVPV